MCGLGHVRDVGARSLELGQDRKVQLHQPVQAGDEDLLDAEESCPVSAIRVTLATSEEVK